MFETNRYDKLQAKAKKLRNKIERRTVVTDAEIKELRTKINEITYKKNVYCENILRKLKDVNSLILNEQNRILGDKTEE